MKPFIFPFQKVASGSRIILYGAGDVGLCLYNQLQVTGYADVALWVDRNYLKYQAQNYPVNKVQAITSVDSYDFVVIAVLDSIVVNQIKNDLIKIGVEPEKIISSIVLQYEENYICSEACFALQFQLLRPNSKVILYGGGNVGLCFYYQLKATRYADRVIWVDKEFEKFKESGLPICGIERLSYSDYDYVIIALENSKEAKKIEYELEQAGIDSNKIIHPRIFFYDERVLTNLREPFLFPFQTVPSKAKIILYGAGDAGVCFYNQLKATGYADIVLWIDEVSNQVENPVVKNENVLIGDHYSSESGRGVCDFWYNKFDYIVIALENVQKANEVVSRLLHYGIPKEKIISSNLFKYDENFVNIKNYFVFPFQMVPPKSKVILYGAGDVGFCFYNQLQVTGYADVVLWVDKNYKNLRSKNLPVNKIEDIKSVKNFDYIVISILHPQIASQVAENLLQSDLGRGGGINRKNLIYNNIPQFNTRYMNEITEPELDLEILEKDIPIKDLILAQYYIDDYSRYTAYDLAVRVLAIEEYYGKNQIGFDLYNRLDKNIIFDHVEKFKQLIKDNEHTSSRSKVVVEVDRQLAIITGADLVALALYHGDEFIHVKLLNYKIEREFDKNFFWVNHFTAEEWELINNKMESIFRESNYKFIGVIWPSAFNFADDLLCDMNLYMPEEVKVESYKDFNLKRKEFEYLLHALYVTDFPNEYIQNRKISRILLAMPKAAENFPLRIFYLSIKNPQIGVNPIDKIDSRPQSKTIKMIKETFRLRYKDRVTIYNFDNIMHIGDNYLQTKFNKIIFEFDRDVSDLFEVIKGYDYAILKYKNTRQSPRFPKTFTSSACIDFLVKQEDIEPLSKLLVKYFSEKYSIAKDNNWIDIVDDHYDKASAIVYMRLRGIYKFFGVDLQTIERFEMTPLLNEECLGSKQVDEVEGVKMNYIPDKWDLMIRAVELIRKPRKIWHKKYIKEHFSELDFDLLDRAFGDNVEYKEKVKTILKQIKED